METCTPLYQLFYCTCVFSIVVTSLAEYRKTSSCRGSNLGLLACVTSAPPLSCAWQPNNQTTTSSHDPTPYGLCESWWLLGVVARWSSGVLVVQATASSFDCFGNMEEGEGWKDLVALTNISLFCGYRFTLFLKKMTRASSHVTSPSNLIGWL